MNFYDGKSSTRPVSAGILDEPYLSFAPMSSTGSYQCLSCRLRDLTLQTAKHGRRQFHASTFRKANRKPAFPNVKAADMGLLERRASSMAQNIQPYSEGEMQILAKRYTPEQLAAIEAGERSIDPQDLAQQGRLRSDRARIKYFDDFSTLRPVLDQPVAKAEKPREKDQERPSDRRGRPQRDEENQEEEDPHMVRLSQQTGLSKDEIRKLRIKNLVCHRVVNQTRMGKIQSMYFLTIAGNEKGLLGIGEGKAAETEDGSRQAMMAAIRNMRPVSRYEERTIYGEVEAKVGASVVKLSARPPGFGNRCQHLIFELARAAGISDLAARTPRSRNKMNVVKAAYQALMSQRLPEDVARARGRKMVDVRRVYYGGQVY